MVQLDYRDKTFLIGKIGPVLIRLKEMESRFKTVREYLDFQTKEL